MSDLNYVDGRLVQWGERWDWSQQNTKPRPPKKSHLGTLLVGLALRQAPRPAVTAASARRSLNAFVRNTPQVVVKITGGGKGLAHIAAHLTYISRDGQLELEDEQGNRHSGADAVQELRELWAYGQASVPEEGQYREAINVILAMPDGTDEGAVLEAARAFALATFGENHQYAMVQHTFDTDPDPEPSRNPHVHLVVKVRGKNGARLNPRKNDLWAWRERFAEELRERGVNAVTTRRKMHLKRAKGESHAVRGINERAVTQGGPRPKRESTTQSQEKAVTRARQTAHEIVRDYLEIAKVLAGSPNRDDNKLAVGITQRLVELSKGVELGRDVAPRDVSGR